MSENRARHIGAGASAGHTTTGADGDTVTAYVDPPVDVKVRLSALWIAMLFVFAYVDIFAFFRADVLEAALDGEVAGTGLAISQGFLAGALVFILVPCLMVVLSLVLPARPNRVANLVVSVLYAVTILGLCIGETWIYYLAGSAVEAALLFVIARTAWTWPRR